MIVPDGTSDEHGGPMAAGTSQYNGKTDDFCSKSCRTKFDADPARYVK